MQIQIIFGKEDYDNTKLNIPRLGEIKPQYASSDVAVDEVVYLTLLMAFFVGNEVQTKHESNHNLLNF